MSSSLNWILQGSFRLFFLILDIRSLYSLNLTTLVLWISHVDLESTTKLTILIYVLNKLNDTFTDKELLHKELWSNSLMVLMFEIDETSTFIMLLIFIIFFILYEIYLKDFWSLIGIWGVCNCLNCVERYILSLRQ